MNRIGLWAAVVVVGCVSTGWGGYRPFTFTYDTYPMAKGEAEFEQWVTYKGHKNDERGFTRFDMREEVEFGVTDNFRLGLYVPSWRYEDSVDHHGFSFDTVGVEGIWLLSNPVTDAFGSGLYGEVNVGEEELEVEAKLLLQKDIGNWTLAYNLVGEAEIGGIGFRGNRHHHDVETVLGHTFGASYGVNSHWRVGGEAIVESIFADWNEYEKTTVYAGPVVSYAGSRIPGTNWTWWATLTPTVQVTNHDDEPDFQIRLIAGITF